MDEQKGNERKREKEKRRHDLVEMRDNVKLVKIVGEESSEVKVDGRNLHLSSVGTGYPLGSLLILGKRSEW